MNKGSIVAGLLVIMLVVIGVGCILYYFLFKTTSDIVDVKSYSCDGNFSEWNVRDVSCDVPQTNLTCRKILPMNNGDVYCDLDDLVVKE